MGKPRFHVASLGCAKNTVDSESMAALLEASGYLAVSDPAQADVLIVNTCGFIGPAKEESLSVLREFAETKRPGQLLLAAGCLTQRYGAEVVAQAPGVDGVLGTRRWVDIVGVVRKLRQGDGPKPVYHLPESGPVVMESPGVRRAAVQGASAYLKIADGCRRPCAFCAIPLIKGTAVSRAPEAILHDAAELDRLGVHEVNLIAQDTTDYGWDLGIKDGFPLLLESLLRAAPSIEWFRILYAYPGYVTDRLMEMMASNPRLVPYLDMPLQHAHPDTLRRMRRPANTDWVYRTIEKMRRMLPDLALRTTFLVGYPGETEREFQTLLDFVAEVRFDRVGTFTFSFEPGTVSEPLGDPVSAEIKEERRDRLMALQQSISLQKNQSMIGRTLPVLIEGQGDGLSLGRSYRDAPEIDGMVLVEGKAPIGAMVPVRVTGALAYDLSGTVVDPA
ncbi:MAG: 30S ribosomal protein S12 methylthiotransferase RimO [Chloroflexi bacterium]|nr:30S ribosomal protein S12 methylthiotransferase RimO [Chloroflexota bacterium]